MAHNLAQGHTPTIADSTSFIRTIHSLLSDVASHITQLRIDNICRDAGLPTAPLAANSDDEDALLDTTRIFEQSKLSKAIQDAQSKDHFSKSSDKSNLSGTTSRPTTPSAPRASNSSSHNSRVSNSNNITSTNSNRDRDLIITREESDRENPWSRFPFPSLHRTQEDRRPSSRTQSTTTKSVRTTKTIQNGNYSTRLQNDPTARLPYFYRPTGCIPPCTSSLSLSKVDPSPYTAVGL
ncbi:uncharacterized protein BX663DRAFT_547664 [Cokeromyces recurvatus]|uniref:uncharacterized protein n=1 Tax=Cokeromyces recurvatus TaxID=90255 RepID=UPI0022205531|nr:uncharacterized protein BX663DRAFT_547664 [Cokeromyces recurvatus]KAI7908031.1 hypothetical protein BX663DRAFT_547664 [Cokeromyces recurvatus]